MHTTTINAIGALGIGAIATLAGVGGHDVVTQYSSPPHSRVIELIELKYDGGKIGQDLVVQGAPEIPATWTSIIRRAGLVGSLCRGSGKWNYPARSGGTIRWFTPDEWTEDTCPKLAPGDILSVTYEYTTSAGFVAVSGGNLEITKEMLK